ncbi:hypothetical protein X275_01445 [Marinitoga sp. 1197]|uniref:hypothetical protein n=1 Tax=unclassified Marinitoga TaxID=2640159 RepID=UPI000640ED07|nr:MULTISPECIES: hypothetical protein [unclassified Marinitoga]AJW76936.1 hypothetical protein UF08_47 [Marinitoga camini virus 1]KLO24077.1 hypothetical protein X275_01445 [Marinitoga sp. 1197]KLO24833.1 hypothetical protein X274_02515 [Marinitoga sp. 1155]
MKLEIGDVLLLPTKKVETYKIIASVLGQNIAKLIKNITDQDYLHAEMYIGNGYIMAAWLNGVHIAKYPLEILRHFDVYRHRNKRVKTIIREKIKEDLKAFVNGETTKYIARPYDLQSLILNSVSEIIGIVADEENFEDSLNFDNPNAYICSELIARIYHDAGVDIKQNLEFVSPDDIAKSEEMIKIL